MSLHLQWSDNYVATFAVFPFLSTTRDSQRESFKVGLATENVALFLSTELFRAKTSRLSMKAPDWLLCRMRRAFWMDGTRMNRSRSCVWVLIVQKENFPPLPPNSRPRACSFARGRRWKSKPQFYFRFSPSSSSSSSSSDKEYHHGRDESSSRPPSQRSHQITSIIIVVGVRVCASDWILTRKSTHETIPRIEGKNWRNTNTDAGEILVKDSMSTAQTSTHGMMEGMPKSGFFKYSFVVVDWTLQSGWRISILIWFLL